MIAAVGEREERVVFHLLTLLVDERQFTAVALLAEHDLPLSHVEHFVTGFKEFTAIFSPCLNELAEHIHPSRRR